ncbi:MULTISPECIES: hypothetical protein [Sporosarcina]|uniref:hypothetical protein n=1 Tax=Sporosarcina TaxID=1569 RepID=UPI00078B84A8|nr:hypothetical protein [Sporosarcina psychrophila]AMQ05793.1 hypothetical protein AZE41_07600 [Sporosarcina psychrophila]
MKELSMLFIILGTLLVGSFQKEQIEKKTGYLDLKEKSGIAIFSKAVSDSTSELGIVNMVNPSYRFDLGEESYSLWISEDNGTIMNTKDTHTIYRLSTSSVQEVNGFVNRD